MATPAFRGCQETCSCGEGDGVATPVFRGCQEMCSSFTDVAGSTGWSPGVGQRAGKSEQWKHSEEETPHPHPGGMV